MANEHKNERAGVSGAAVAAGALVAFGSVALVLAVAGAMGSNLGISTDGISTDSWRQADMAGAVVAAVVLFACFLFGGYAAGRMAPHRGARHGTLVFLTSAAVIGVIVVLAATWGDPGQVADQLGRSGVPTDVDTWSDIGLGAIVAAVVAMLLGSVIGGRQGGRWYRAMDRERRAVIDLRAAEERRARTDAELDARAARGETSDLEERQLRAGFESHHS